MNIHGELCFIQWAQELGGVVGTTKDGFGYFGPHEAIEQRVTFE
jgi:hypothetical protein